MAKVTLSLDDVTLARARAEAERAGLTLSAWFDVAARRYVLRGAGHRYKAWLDRHPDIREEVDGLTQFAARTRSDWHELGEPA